jgi:hypothetical protein
VQVLEGVVERTLAKLERDGRYVSDGAGGVVAERRPAERRAEIGQK